MSTINHIKASICNIGRGFDTIYQNFDFLCANKKLEIIVIMTIRTSVRFNLYLLPTYSL